MDAKSKSMRTQQWNTRMLCDPSIEPCITSTSSSISSTSSSQCSQYCQFGYIFSYYVLIITRFSITLSLENIFFFLATIIIIKVPFFSLPFSPKKENPRIVWVFFLFFPLFVKWRRMLAPLDHNDPSSPNTLVLGGGLMGGVAHEHTQAHAHTYTWPPFCEWETTGCDCSHKNFPHSNPILSATVDNIFLIKHCLQSFCLFFFFGKKKQGEITDATKHSMCM